MVMWVLVKSGRGVGGDRDGLLGRSVAHLQLQEFPQFLLDFVDFPCPNGL